MTFDALFGLTSSHCSNWIDERLSPTKSWLLHHDAIHAWQALVCAAEADGIKIAPLSTFRDFARQRLIWNEKFNGLRPVLDEQNNALVKTTDEWAWCENILRFSALPGLSRHHWGSEIDVFDATALAQGVRPQLSANEFCGNGPCASLAQWLHHNARRFDFYFPYTHPQNGVAPEPWHLSYIPVAQMAMQQINADALCTVLRNNDIAGASLILPRLATIIARYAMTVDPIPS